LGAHSLFCEVTFSVEDLKSVFAKVLLIRHYARFAFYRGTEYLMALSPEKFAHLRHLPFYNIPTVRNDRRARKLYRQREHCKGTPAQLGKLCNTVSRSYLGRVHPMARTYSKKPVK
jgi:hypothetical protein